MRFLVEKARPGVPPADWDEVGVADHSGKGSPARAVEELATEAGKYRVRPEADPDASFALVSVDADGKAHAVDVF